jgi:hypothetical protein
MKTEAWVIARRPAGDGRSPHVPPTGWFGELVGCSYCGHGIGRHTSQGCGGDFRGPCRCTCSPDTILTIATQTARYECSLDG